MEEKENLQESPSFDLLEVFYLEKEILAFGKKIDDSNEKLDNLQRELEQTEHRRAEAEAKTKKMDEEIVIAEKQKNSLRDQYNELYAEWNLKSDELQYKKAELEKVRNQLSLINIDRLARIGRGRKRISKNTGFRTYASIVVLYIWVVAMLILFSTFSFWLSVLMSILLLFAMLCGWRTFFGLYGENFRLSQEMFRLNGEISGLNEKISGLETTKAEIVKLSDIKDYAGAALVKVNNVYNGNNGKKIGDLKASEMRYLMFDFSVCFLEDNVGEATIYVDIYNPDGSLSDSTHSPNGHTFAENFVGSGNRRQGWGNSETSVYTFGTYRVDFIYKDVIIHSQKVVISD